VRFIVSLFILLSYCSIVLSQTFRGTVVNLRNDSTVSMATIYFDGTSAGTYSNINGHFDASALNLDGEMARGRIADLLPYDYSENMNNNPDQTLEDSLSVIEKVYLHTDRTYFYPGDDIWFKAYLIEATERLLSNHSNNLHVELISPDSEITLSSIIRMESGLGHGDFQLPENIKSGRYLLRAYTNYMRNFGEQLFFSKEIVVINSLEPHDSISHKTENIKNNTEISFFPEGGSLVDNVSSIVAFKAVDAIGKGCDVNGEIYSSAGELVTAFRSTHLGMGSFLLKPDPGLSYFSVIKGPDGNEIRDDIPKSLPTGVTLSVSVNKNKELSVTTRTNPQTLPLYSDHELLLRISVRKEIIKTLGFRIKSFNNNLLLPIENLPDGIIMLTLLTSDNVPLAERLIFIQKDKSIRINIEANKLIYSKRDSVSLNISLSIDSGIPPDAYLSLAAAGKGFADNSSKYPSTIASWFLIESEVRGPIEEPSCYFDPSNPDRFRNLDLLLRTQGWRDFSWKYDKSIYLPENGFKVSGRLRKSLLNKPLESSRVNIGIFEGKNSIFTIVPTDSSGRFFLDGIDLTGEGRLIVSGINNKDHLQGLLNLDSVKYTPAIISGRQPVKKILPEEGIVALKQEYEINSAVRKKYKLTDTIALGEVKIIAVKPKDLQTIKIENSRISYGEPDDEIIITRQLESYRNAVEIIRGMVAGVEVRDNYPNYIIRIRGVHTFSSNAVPLVLVDGFRRSFDDLINMPVYFIDRIDVLKSGGTTAIFGMEGANGVISIITRTSDRLASYETVNYSVNIKFSGYNEARVFYSPKHSYGSMQSYNPDLRSTLFWEPEIRLQNNKNLILNYFNADISATVQVLVEGITTTGIPVTGKIEYEIR
jgi:hypothetical protein